MLRTMMSTGEPENVKAKIFLKSWETGDPSDRAPKIPETKRVGRHNQRMTRAGVYNRHCDYHDVVPHGEL